MIRKVDCYFHFIISFSFDSREYQLITDSSKKLSFTVCHSTACSTMIIHLVLVVIVGLLMAMIASPVVANKYSQCKHRAYLYKYCMDKATVALRECKRTPGANCPKLSSSMVLFFRLMMCIITIILLSLII